MLRSPRVADVGILREMLKRNANHLRRYVPRPPEGVDSTSLAQVSLLVARQRKMWRDGTGYTFYGSLKGASSEIPIARIALTNVSRGPFQSASLGYFVDGESLGQGICTEAARAVIAFAFDGLGLHRVEAGIMPHNERSLRVAARLGLRREGIALRYLQIDGAWQDHVIFAVTREEWPAPV